MCSITGCCGCAFPRREEIKKGEEAQRCEAKAIRYGIRVCKDEDGLERFQQLKWQRRLMNYDDAAAKLVKRKASRSGTENGEEA
ncbi:hypothetical protein YC2023_087562 [Brassica napus]